MWYMRRERRVALREMYFGKIARRVGGRWWSLNVAPSGGGTALWESPRFGTHDLALAVGPEICHHANNVVQSRVGTLVEQESAEGAEGIDNQAGFDGAVQTGACDEGERPLVCDTEDSHDEVDDLEGWDGSYGGIQVLCQEVPEDLRPKEGFEGGGYLISSGGENDEPRPVVLD